MKSLRLIHVLFSPRGGAGAATSELHAALVRAGNSSKMVSRTDSNLRSDPLKAPLTAIFAWLDRYVVQKKSSRLSQFSLFRTALKLRVHGQYDLVHFPWTPGISNFNRRSKPPGAKVIYSLHDDFLFTGGCHSAGACKQYQTGCIQCPMVRGVFRPLVRSQSRRKADYFAKSENTLILAPTNWMKKRASTSSILSGSPVVAHANLINPIFIETEIDWTKVGSGAGTRVGFVAANLSDPNKNLDRVLSVARVDDRIIYDIVGKLDPFVSQPQLRNVFFRGELNSADLARLAQDWDWLFVPSFAENSPQVINEMACLGVPTLTFGVGATSEMIRNLGRGCVVSAGKDNLEIANIFCSRLSATSRQQFSKRSRELFRSEQLAQRWLKIVSR